MAKSTFKYCTQRDVKDCYPNISETDNKVVIRNWKVLSGEKYASDNTGVVTALFQDGEHLGSAQADASSVDGNLDWHYSSQWDRLYFHSATDPNELLMEAGEDWATLIDRMIVNCSMELSAMLDARFPRPIPKSFQYAEATDGSDTPEYDYILVRATALLVAHHLLISKDPMSEEAMKLKEEVDSIIERLNDGSLKLGFEVDNTDTSGDIVEVTNTGSMYLMETSGEWYGEAYDRVKIKCVDTGGAYGVAKVTAYYYGSNKIYGSSTSDIIVTGALTDIVNGLSVRFEGKEMAIGDEWHVVLRNFHQQTTNSGVRSIRATHGNRINKLVYRG